VCVALASERIAAGRATSARVARENG